MWHQRSHQKKSLQRKAYVGANQITMRLQKRVTTTLEEGNQYLLRTIRENVVRRKGECNWQKRFTREGPNVQVTSITRVRTLADKSYRDQKTLSMRANAICNLKAL